MSAIATPAIQAIDKQIDANRRELCRRSHARLDTARDWQNAWDRNPDLWERERALFRQRGVAQQERDAQAQKAAMREQRSARAKARRGRPTACPTCGCMTLSAGRAA